MHVVRLDRIPTEGVAASQLLSGLAGSTKCVAPDGTISMDGPIEPGQITLQDNDLALNGIGGEADTYRVFVEITTGAPALAGVGQHLMAKNGMCGLERLPAA